MKPATSKRFLQPKAFDGSSNLEFIFDFQAGSDQKVASSQVRGPGGINAPGPKRQMRFRGLLMPN